MLLFINFELLDRVNMMILQVLKKIIGILDNLNIPYMLSGSELQKNDISELIDNPKCDKNYIRKPTPHLPGRIQLNHCNSRSLVRTPMSVPDLL